MTTDAKILSALRASPDGVSGAQLAEQLGISRAAVWARIEELRRLDYDIEASPHLGYRLVNSPDALHADDLLARLGRTKVIGRDIQVFEQTTSTNDVMEKLARDGVPEGVVVVQCTGPSGVRSCSSWRVRVSRFRRRRWWPGSVTGSGTRSAGLPIPNTSRWCGSPSTPGSSM